MTVVQWQSQLAQNTDQVVAQSGKLVRDVTIAISIIIERSM
jgi:hypothetical protein